MLKQGYFGEKQPAYRYFPLGNGKADVFIYNFIKEIVEKITEGDEEVENTSFLYDVNEFRVNSDEITEEMVKENPEKYLNYTTPQEVTIEERLTALEDGLLDMAQEVAENG